MWPDVVITGISAFLDPISHVILRSILRKPLVVHHLNLSHVDTAAYRHTYAFNSVRSLNLSGSKVHPGILTSSHLANLDVSSTNVTANMLTHLVSLTKLHLNQIQLDNVEFLTQFKEVLIELSLVKVTCDLTPLHVLTELRTLVVSVDNLAFMEKLNQLTSVSIVHSTQDFIDVTPLYYLPLQSISIDVDITVDAARQLATISTLIEWDIACVKIPDRIFTNPRLEKLSGQIDEIPIIMSQVLTIVKLNIYGDVPHLRFLPPSVTTLVCAGEYGASISLDQLPPHLTSLDVSLIPISQDDLMGLQDLPLTCLRLVWTTVHTLKFIQRMQLHTLMIEEHPLRRNLHNIELMCLNMVKPTLTHLDLTCTDITDEGLQYITGFSLTHLDLFGMPITTCSVPVFLTMPLQTLDLTCIVCNLSTIPWDAIGNIPTLKNLYFGNNNIVNDDYVNQLINARLVKLDIRGTITDACVDTLLRMPLLSLTMTYSRLSEVSKAQLRQKLVTFMIMND